MNVGIDLGTTNTLVSYVDDVGSVKKISFTNGRPENRFLLPSCIAYNSKKDAVLVGQAALDYEQNDLIGARRIIRDTKYHMGDPKKVWEKGNHFFSAEDTATEILKEVMRELRSQFPNEEEFSAYVTVPARFDTQEPRAATKSAMKRAGFKPASENNTLTDEPVAAAIAYSKELQNARNILVVDFGGGTFDLALLRSSIVGQATSADRLEPIAWGGDIRLGGNDVDNVLISIIAEKVFEDRGVDISIDFSSVSDLSNYKPEDLAAAVTVHDYVQSMEGIKSKLYSRRNTEENVYLSELFEDYSLKMSVSAETYKERMKPLADRMRKCIADMYSAFHVSPESTDKVLVVGGMAHEICLIDILTEMFAADKLVIPEDSLYLVSRGAAICNSSLKVHVENKAYSTIAVVVADPSGNGNALDMIVTEGMSVLSDFIVRRKYTPNVDNARYLQLSFIEYVGEYDRRRSNPFYSVELVLNKPMKKQKQIVQVEYRFNEDKLFVISARQVDGTVTNYSVRL